MNEVSTVLVHPSQVYAAGIRQMLARTAFKIEQCVANADGLEDLEGAQTLFIVGGASTSALRRQVSQISAERADAKIAALSSGLASSDLLALLLSGAQGVVDENLERCELVHALQLINRGSAVFPSRILSDIRGAAGAQRAPAPTDRRAIEERSLSAREVSLLGCLRAGASNKEIARELEVTEAPVKVHVKAVLRKVRVKNRTQAAIWAFENLPDPHESNAPVEAKSASAKPVGEPPLQGASQGGATPKPATRSLPTAGAARRRPAVQAPAAS